LFKILTQKEDKTEVLKEIEEKKTEPVKAASPVKK